MSVSTIVIDVDGHAWELAGGRIRQLTRHPSEWVDGWTQDSVDAAAQQHETILIESDRDEDGQRGTHQTIGPVLAAYTAHEVAEIEPGIYIALVDTSRGQGILLLR